MSKVYVAIGQCGSIGTPEENAKMVEFMFLEAVNKNPGLDLVVFPEYIYYSPVDQEDSQRVAIDLNQSHPYIDRMKALAKKYQINFVPGSFVEKADDGRVHNTAIFINREGEIIGKYRKVHLMDAASYKESAYVAPGDKLCLIDADFGKVGLMVCYDLRFPEQARSMCLQGAEIIIVPAQFPAGAPLPPRVDDWDILTRSAALTNLTYVVAANQFGAVHKDHPFGRSGVIDPRGIVIAAASGRPEMVYGTIDLDYQRQVQKNLAAWSNRRPDIYTL